LKFGERQQDVQDVAANIYNSALLEISFFLKSIKMAVMAYPVQNVERAVHVLSSLFQSLRSVLDESSPRGLQIPVKSLHVHHFAARTYNFVLWGGRILFFNHELRRSMASTVSNDMVLD
jgi:hypothetical protein